jgi:hypothetical protein
VMYLFTVNKLVNKTSYTETKFPNCMHMYETFNDFAKFVQCEMNWVELALFRGPYVVCI